MRNITINLPDFYVKLLTEIGEKTGRSRSELIRKAIEDRLEKDLHFFAIIEKIYPDIQVERKKREEIQQKIEFKRLVDLKKKRELEFYNYCILCDRKLHPETKPKKISGFNIYELRFCCTCFEKYEGLTLDEFPKSVSRKIKKKLERYKELTKKNTKFNNENSKSGSS
ncbi:MAG: ribbon-helix-helix protein, CopG family [Promethearchaeota archaeon]